MGAGFLVFGVPDVWRSEGSRFAGLQICVLVAGGSPE